MMSDEDFEYASDYIDEEAEARLYELAYYGEDSVRTSTLISGKIFHVSQASTSYSLASDNRLSQRKLEANNISSDSESNDSDKLSYRRGDTSEVVVHSATVHSLIGSNFNKERLKATMEALFLTLTGRCPYNVEKKAEERMLKFSKRLVSFKRNDLYFSSISSSNSSDEGLLSGSRKADIILGISNPSYQRLAGASSIPKWFEDLPSDSKYWTLDAGDLRPGKKKRSFRDDNEICLRCYGKGHYEWDCTRNDLFCVLCAKEGHLQSSCPLQVCPLCLRRGHDLPCPNKRQVYNTTCFRCKQKGHMSNRCPDIWRQYRFSTKFGPPIKYETYQNQPKTCFNCGGRGHLGHECSRSSAYGQPLLSQIVAEFDKHDVYSEATVKRKPQNVNIEKKSGNSLVQESEFDEPLYCSFNTGPSDSIPEGGTLLLDKPNWTQGFQKRKHTKGCFRAGRGRHSRESMQTINQFASCKNRWTSFGCSRGPSAPNHTAKSSALNGFVSKIIENSFERREMDEPAYRNNCPSLFLSNGFLSKKHRGHLLGDDQDRLQGKSTNDFQQSQLGRLRRNKSYRQVENSFRKRGKQIIKRKVKKSRNSAGNDLPNISNSPFLQFIDKLGWNGVSSNISPHPKWHKCEKKNRLAH